MDTSDAAHREAVSAAQSQYLVQLFTDHAAAASSLLADPSADAARQQLVWFQASVTAAAAAWAADLASGVAGHQAQLTRGGQDLTLRMNVSESAQALAAQVADLVYATAVADANKNWWIEHVDVQTDLSVDVATK